MTRLSCHRFRANEVRLWLSVIAYNLGNLWRRLALPAADRHLVADQLAAAAGENRGPSDKTRPLLLVAAGGESPDAAALWRHAAKDRDAAVAGGIKRPRSGANFDDAPGTREKCRRNRWGKQHFSRREPARCETGPPRAGWEPAEQNRLKPCRGKPFDLWKELKFERQKGNSRLGVLNLSCSLRGSHPPRLIGLLIFASAFGFALLSARDYAGSWNDGSRLAAVQSLVDYHTFTIDRSIFVQVPQQAGASPYGSNAMLNRSGTRDMVRIDGRIYSGKPPVQSLLMASVYAIAKLAFGLDCASQARACSVIS